MGVMRSVQTGDGWYVKSNADGDPLPLESGLAIMFNAEGINTLPGTLQHSARVFGGRQCMAARKLLARERREVNGKTIEKLKLGEYVSQSYAEVQEIAEAVGKGMRSYGVQPFSRLAIFAETRAEWFMTAMGCLQQRITVATLYTTLNDSGVAHGINETEVPVVFTSFDLLPRLLRIISECPKVNQIIVMEDQLEGIGDASKFPSRVSVIPFRELVSAGSAYKMKEVLVPDPEDIAILMYTSGSTGNPKGVELTHTNILASVIAYSVQMNVGLEDRFLAFLPLAHIMELASEVALISIGVLICYSSPLTLTGNSPKIMEGTQGDAKIAKPTVMNAVPLVMDRIIKGVTQAAEKQGWLKNLIFTEAVRYRPYLEYLPFTGMFLNFFVFRRVQEELGGQLCRMVVGGAPLSPHTQSTMKSIFGCSIQVGYGSTETASCSTGMDEDDYSMGRVGGPNLNALMRLIDWEEGGYRLTDVPNPRGEILIGGSVVAKGYFKLPQESKEAFFEEDGIRWFKTGDIGELDELGTLKIIDRMKDLVKLKHGEYVSLGNTESLLKTLTCIDNICLFAEPMYENTVAVVVPAIDRLMKIAAEAGYPDDATTEQLCNEEQITNIVFLEIQRHGRKCGLSRWDIPGAITLCPETWTPDTGLVTAALKIRRKQLAQHYEQSIHDMYAKLEEQY